MNVAGGVLVGSRREVEVGVVHTRAWAKSAPAQKRAKQNNPRNNLGKRFKMIVKENCKKILQLYFEKFLVEKELRKSAGQPP